jgi:transposase
MRRLAAEESVPALAREMLDVLAGQLEAVNAKLKGIEARLMAWHRRDQTSQCLATIPGIGPIGGVSFALKIPQAKAFRSGRHPGLRQGRLLRRGSGITPRENSTAGKHRPGNSREGDESLRRRLVLGATAVIQQPRRAAPRRGCWDCWRASQRSWPRSRWLTRWPASSGP